MTAEATCTLNRTIVDGNIEVKSNATLHAIEVTVEGNIQAKNANAVIVNHASRIGGNIQIEQGGSATIEQVHVEGDIQLESNNGTLRIALNRVGGNIQVFQNADDILINDNFIDGDLQCKQNNPAPVGGRNVADSYEDQCAGFGGTPLPSPTPTPGARGVECNGVIDSQQVTDDLVVPDDVSCILQGTQIVGDLIVGAGATLQGSGVRVSGSVQAEGATAVILSNNSTINGNVRIKGSDSATVDRVWIGGDLQLESTRNALTTTRNRVGGNLRALGNQGGIVMCGNMISGALQCSANQFTPIVSTN